MTFGLVVRITALLTILTLASGCQGKGSLWNASTQTNVQDPFSSDFSVVTNVQERFYMTSEGEMAGQPSISLFAANGRRQMFDVVDTARLGNTILRSSSEFLFFQNRSELSAQVLQVPLKSDSPIVLYSLVGKTGSLESRTLALRPISYESSEKFLVPPASLVSRRRKEGPQLPAYNGAKRNKDRK